MSNQGVGLIYLDPGHRFHLSKEGTKIIKELVDGNEKFRPFETQVEAYMLALSVGIITGEQFQADLGDTIFILATYRNYDPYGVYPLVVKSMYPEMDEATIGRTLEKFAEGGLRVLQKEFKNNGRIDFDALISLSREKT